MNPPLASLLRKHSEPHWPDPASTIQRPEFLCKYRALNDYSEKGLPLLKYTSDIITKCSIWHGSPKDFNDPFDCHINVDANNTKEEIRTYVDLAWANDVKAKRKAVATDLINNQVKFRKLISEQIRKVVDMIPICCYGEEADNILMWSHYGDAHKGVCFKFKVTNDPAFFKDLFKVKYVSRYPYFNLIKHQLEMVDLVLARKSNIWAYEKEWRVFQRDGIGSYHFTKPTLVEIVFGCLANPNKIAQIIALVNADPELNHAAFKQTRLSKTDFALLLKDVPRKN